MNRKSTPPPDYDETRILECRYRNTVDCCIGCRCTVSRIREVIATSGLSQVTFAERVGLRASTLSQSLEGIRRFSSLDIARIAEIAGVTVDWLLGIARSKPATTAPAGGAAGEMIETANLIAEVRTGLASLGHPATSTPDLSFSPDSTATRQGADLAQQALARLPSNALPGSDVDLFDTIEHYFGVEVAVQHLDQWMDGLAYNDEAAQVIVLATSGVPTRQRFTLAHELAHILAGDEQLHIDENITQPHHDTSELRANSFAAHFLMPEIVMTALLGTNMPVDRDVFAGLVMQLGVSPDALARRLYQLGRLSPAVRDQYRGMSTMECGHQAARTDRYGQWCTISRQARSPAALVDDALDAHLGGEITLRPISQLVDVPVATLRATLETGVRLGSRSG